MAYLFGSRARGVVGPLSDYDFAVYLDTRDSIKVAAIKQSLQITLSRFLKTDQVDVVILDTTLQPELKYNIITDGKLLFEKPAYRLSLEPKILNEYFDFRDMLRRYQLTAA